MMPRFATRLDEAAHRGGRIVLACDYDGADIVSSAVYDIRRLSRYLCGVKLNLHLLLPLSADDISQISATARQCGLLCIADIKLNDIGNTNRSAMDELWKMGFDAVIANPIMGASALRDVVLWAHDGGHGVITLCHMSAPQAAGMYEMITDPHRVPLYRTFLDVASSCGVDGIVVGATYPEIIRTCKRSYPEMRILSPGVGIQGGSAQEAVLAGADYIIVGRTIIKSDDPVGTAEQLGV